MGAEELSWEEKKELCEKWKNCGKSKRQFCREEGLPLSSFYGWCERLWPEPVRPMQSHFIAAKLSPMQKQEVKEEVKSTIEVILPNQAVIRLALSMTQAAALIQELCHATTIVR